jgi:carbon monoxide dehydrogenase subunit G
MKIVGSRSIAAPLSVVMPKLLDGRSLVQVTPDLQLNSPLDEQRQRISLTVPVGPMQGQYEAAVSFSQPETAVIELTFDGHGVKGIFNGYGRVHLEAHDTETLIRYEGEIETAGLLADLPPRMFQSNINAIIRRCFDGLEQLIWPEKFITNPAVGPAKPIWQHTAVIIGISLLGLAVVARFMRKLWD